MILSQQIGRYGQKMNAADFFLLLPEIRRVARILGYAVATHGSMARDFDIVAIPWTNWAVHPKHIAKAIMHAAGGMPRFSVVLEQDKPHGRFTYCFHWDRHNYDNKDYCDLSIMPRKGEL